MARLDVRTQNPERYAQVKAEQEERQQNTLITSLYNMTGGDGNGNE